MTSKTPSSAPLNPAELMRLGRAIDALRTNEDARATVGAAIRAMRIAQGIQAKELAAAANVSDVTISLIESGQRAVSGRVYRSIADRLDVPLAAVVTPGDTSGEG